MEVKLDEKDRKLLLALDFHARDSYAGLARRIGTSKQAVDYKLKRLEKLGVINGYYALVNTPNLGYSYCRLLVTLKGTTEETRKNIASFLRKENKVFWLLWMQGQYDMIIDIWAKSTDEFRIFIGECMSRFGKHVKNRSEHIVTDVIHFQNRYITNQAATEEFHLKQSEIQEIDEIDKKLLVFICEDARMPLVNLAEKLGASSVTIANRIRNLEKKGIIAGYRPNIDHNKLGYGYYKIFLNLSNPSAENLKAVKEYLKQQPLVLYIVEGIGFPGDIDFEMVAESPIQLDEFVRRLREAFPGIIADYMALLFTDTLKVKYLPF